ncbi:MAG TPA: peptidoglycan-associated lipoprotein Pal [Acidobacteriota bacterium]
MTRNIVCIFLVLMMMGLIACKKKAPPVSMEPAATSGGMPSEPGPSDMTQTTDLSGMELDEISRRFQPVFFDFNRFEIRADQVDRIQANATILRQNPKITVTLEGHCDERGTEEYNEALGERRASAIKEYLVTLGIPSERIATISYGESRPFASGHNEDSWQQNRRAQSVVLKAQ